MTDRATTGEIRPSAPVLVSFAATRPDVNLARILANIAVVLRGADLNVLVIEPVADGGSVLKFFEPFLAGTSNALDDLTDEDAAFVSTLASSQVVLYRHSSPVGRGKLNVLGPFRPFPRLAAGRPDFAPGARIRDILRQQPYDVVLFGLLAADAQQARLVANVSDRIAICFPPAAERIREAVDGAALVLDQLSVPRPMIAVATPFDADAVRRSERVITEIRTAFRRLPAAVDGRVVRVPELGDDHGLSVLLEDPAAGSMSSTAYGQLAWFATDGRVDSVRAAPFAVRDRHRLSMTPRRVRKGEMQAVIAYEPSDRPWADWTAEQLERVGLTVGSWRPDQGGSDAEMSGTLVILGSAAFNESPIAARVVDHLRRTGGSRNDAVLAQLESGHRDLYPATRLADLTSVNEAEAQRQLLAAFGRAGRLGDGREPRHRFPRVIAAEAAPTVSTPRPTNALVGRNRYLEETRDLLLASVGVGLVVLAGDAGVGKTAIAQEYAIRFRYDYDIVWWIPAGDVQDIRASIARLGFAMGVEPSSDMVTATLDALHVAPPGRTLLVYDAASDLDALRGLVPERGEGHVLITATSDTVREPTSLTVRLLQVEPLASAEAVALLRRYTPALPTSSARRLVEITAQLPLSLHLAGALVRHFASRAEPELGQSASEAADQSAARLAARLPGGGSVGAILRITLEELPNIPFGMVTLRLAELCCFLDYSRVGLAILRWPTMVEQLAAAVGDGEASTLLDEPYDVDQALWLGQRLEIFSVFWGAHPELRLHGLVCAALFEEMTTQETVERRSQAVRGLAGFLAGRSHSNTVLAELRPHLIPSGALDSMELAVRRWVLAQLRWISDDDDAVALQRTLVMVEATYAMWIEHYAHTESLVLQLATWHADLQRTIGQPEQSLKIDRDLVEPAVTAFGPRSVRALTILRGMSGDLRGLGDFYQAKELDKRTWQRFRDLFGEDHPQTLAAAHNLATSYFLAGFPEKALAQEADTLRRRIELFGLDDPFTWWSMADTATYQRELGRYVTAARQLYETLDRVRKSRPANHPDVLRVKGHLAIAERRQGRYAVARQLNSDAFNGYRHALGPDHPRARACQLSLAIDHFRLHEIADARRLAEENLQAYRTHLPSQHPFTEISRMNLALIEWAADDTNAARDHAAEAVAVLAERLDGIHPWVLAARLNLTRMTNQMVRPQLTEIAGLCREFLGAEHPYTLIAAAAVVRGEGGSAVPAPIDIDVPEV